MDRAELQNRQTRRRETTWKTRSDRVNVDEVRSTISGSGISIDDLRDAEPDGPLTLHARFGHEHRPAMPVRRSR